jgi:hypothetical protein
MKNGKPLHQAKKEWPETLTFKPCCVCGGIITDGYYGRHGDGGTCSHKCELVKATQPRYPGYTEEDFLIRQSEQEQH